MLCSSSLTCTMQLINNFFDFIYRSCNVTGVCTNSLSNNHKSIFVMLKGVLIEHNVVQLLKYTLCYFGYSYLLCWTRAWNTHKFFYNRSTEDMLIFVYIKWSCLELDAYILLLTLSWNKSQLLLPLFNSYAMK